MSTVALRMFFISRGGGPWPWVEDREPLYARTAQWLSQLPYSLMRTVNAQYVGAHEQLILLGVHSAFCPRLFDAEVWLNVVCHFPARIAACSAVYDAPERVRGLSASFAWRMAP